MTGEGKQWMPVGWLGDGEVVNPHHVATKIHIMFLDEI
jgi:hypothetical protein